MNEFLEAFMPAWLTPYVYPPFILVSYAVVEWLRYQFDGIDNRIKPKHLTAVIGIVVGIGCYFLELKIEGVDIGFVRLLISYLVMTILYEYVIKPLKEKFLPKIAEHQKQ